LIDNYNESIRAMSAVGADVLCYNFMPVFDWMRTDLGMPLDDGSRTLAFDGDSLTRIDLSRGTGDLPGWATAYDAPALDALLTAYRDISEERLWEHLAYFLERVVPAAESSGVRMSIHPDDPPWSILGLPRIITNCASLDRLVSLVDSPANGITFCTGSLASRPDNDVPAMARAFATMGRIHFAHCRNVRRTGSRRFEETPHPSAFGEVDMAAVLAALRDGGFAGPMRPDHGRMIWGETGRPGYGLYDRALGAMYLQGLWEGLNAER
jgi:mannonate dehydratase